MLNYEMQKNGNIVILDFFPKIVCSLEKTPRIEKIRNNAIYNVFGIIWKHRG